MQRESFITKWPTFSASASGVVDTIGAGDTFVAAAVTSLSKGLDLRTALDYGCRVAGAKVGIKGFNVFSLA